MINFSVLTIIFDKILFQLSQVNYETSTHCLAKILLSQAGALYLFIIDNTEWLSFFIGVGSTIYTIFYLSPITATECIALKNRNS